MTIEELRKEAGVMMAAAETQLKFGFELRPQMRVHHPSGGWANVPLPPDAAEGMNSGEYKRWLFGIVRELVQMVDADACIFLSDIWRGRVTRNGRAHMDTEEWTRLVDTGFETLAKLGWMERQECIQVTAQSKESVLFLARPYRRVNGKLRWSDEVEVLGPVPQAQFQGRLKMFGDLSEKNLGEHPDALAG